MLFFFASILSSLIPGFTTSAIQHRYDFARNSYYKININSSYIICSFALFACNYINMQNIFFPVYYRLSHTLSYSISIMIYIWIIFNSYKQFLCRVCTVDFSLLWKFNPSDFSDTRCINLSTQHCYWITG